LPTSDSLVDRRLDLATVGLESHYINCLRRLRLKVNASTIADFILSMRTDINLFDNHRRSFIVILTRLSEFYNKEEKSFKEMARDDIVLFLDSFRKPEIEDPLHKWIGTYNLYRSLLLRFFRWLYYPDVESGKRSTPNSYLFVNKNLVLNQILKRS
jgi:hypothetical protein